MGRQLTYEDERNSFEDRLELVNQQRHSLILVLDGLTDARNIGSIFRLADAANLSHIYFHNCSVAPTDKRLKKTSRSTHKYVPASIIDFTAFKILKETHQIVALEITTDSIPYTQIKATAPMILVIGAESKGVSEQVLSLTDQSIHIPMYGINTSMNVSTAVGIAIFHIIQLL